MQYSICNPPSAQITAPANEDDFLYTVYPNPAQNTLYISKMSGFIVSKSKPLIEVFDLSGKLVMSENLNEFQTKFDISFLNPSMYVYTISIDNNPVQFGKISVVK